MSKFIGQTEVENATGINSLPSYTVLRDCLLSYGKYNNDCPPWVASVSARVPAVNCYGIYLEDRFWDYVPGLVTLSGIIKGVALQALLLARTYAVSHGNRWIGIGLAFLIFIYACFGIVIAGVYFTPLTTIDVDPL
ncbi:hypothetical protein M422DRAFT_263495 [Sphaerobolus stellatus SS14]|uniref:Uncharacterized protein n=1 Tax=Sphaerobolus stellatus (strain SS14) TaxID=990650 RepID=A0A0C9TVL3_SPHS4|nr:hypothetical protein M422DRAFT_263495 [Sphaerobolus stellatus SS14]